MRNTWISFGWLLIWLWFGIDEILSDSTLHIEIEGIIYDLFWIMGILANGYLLWHYAQALKHKEMILGLSMLSLFAVKHVYGALLVCTTVVWMRRSLHDERVTRMGEITCMLCDFVCYPLMFLAVILYFFTWIAIDIGIYEDSHYLCDYNTEIYKSSAGATDRVHDTVNRYALLLDMGDMLQITYRKKVGDDQALYDKIRREYDCIGVGESDGSK